MRIIHILLIRSVLSLQFLFVRTNQIYSLYFVSELARHSEGGRLPERWDMVMSVYMLLCPLIHR